MGRLDRLGSSHQALLGGSQRVTFEMPVVARVHIDRIRPWSAFGGIEKRGRINEHYR